MAHFAEIDENNIVTRVLVVPDHKEHCGVEYLRDELGLGGTWLQTSYNNNLRANYAGIGFIYDPVKDWFIAPQPYPSWLLNDKAQWEAPVEYPTDGLMYKWNEEKVDWEAVNYDN